MSPAPFTYGNTTAATESVTYRDDENQEAGKLLRYLFALYYLRFYEAFFLLNLLELLDEFFIPDIQVNYEYSKDWPSTTRTALITNIMTFMFAFQFICTNVAPDKFHNMRVSWDQINAVANCMVRDTSLQSAFAGNKRYPKGTASSNRPSNMPLISPHSSYLMINNGGSWCYCKHSPDT